MGIWGWGLGIEILWVPKYLPIPQSPVNPQTPPFPFIFIYIFTIELYIKKMNKILIIQNFSKFKESLMLINNLGIFF